MSEAPSPIPFELVGRPDGTWRSYWSTEKVFVVVGGSEQAPAAPLMETLYDVVARWTDLKSVITAFVRGLASGHHVPLDPPSLGGFAARSCGFDQPLTFQAISVTFIDAPHRVAATFYTGYPDGYATYEVILEHGVPIAISSFAS